ncbi:MAG: hypothetical protein M1819_003263 [Sarea resinae]|nr:MAG: hypothetical protein M1819_003263 [Sarea resinae]
MSLPTVTRTLKPTRSHLLDSPPIYLIPSLFSVHTPSLSVAAPTPASTQQTSRFSTSPSAAFPRDTNRNRGVSALRRTGPRHPLSVSKEPLPQPVALDPSKRSKVPVDENHGLWQFFGKARTALSTPEELFAFGRSWSVEELRGKSWEDLHSLWWTCAKERNRIATSDKERERLKAGYGEWEAQERDKVVRETQRAIKHALTERWYAWDEARKVARSDPEVKLTGDGPAYLPQAFEDDIDHEIQASAEAEARAAVESDTASPKGAKDKDVKSARVPLSAVGAAAPAGTVA